MSVGMGAVQSDKQSQIDATLSSLENVVSRLESITDKVEKRFNSVLISSVPRVEIAQTKEPVIMVPLANLLKQQINRIEDSICRLDDIIQRTEL